MTIDAICDHTAVNPDAEVHQHFTDLLNGSDTLLYGRITYLLMQSYWPALVKNPSGNKMEDDFANAIDNINKIVFSRTLSENDPVITGWRNTQLKKEIVRDEMLALKQQSGGDILAGSPSLIITLLNLKLVDELQLMVHPTISGKGQPLFKNISAQIELRLLKTKTFRSGAVNFYFEPTT